MSRKLFTKACNSRAITAILLAGLYACTSTNPDSAITLTEQPAHAVLQVLAASEERLVTVYYRMAGAAPADRARRLRDVGVKFESRLHGSLPAALSIPRSDLPRLLALPWINLIEVDSSPPVVPVSFHPVSPLFLMRSLLPVQTIPWGVQDIGAPIAHGRGFRGAGVKIAFLDEAAKVTHPDLVFAGCYDTFGAGNLCVYDGDGFDHGTKVAGVLAALDNGSDVLGVAPQAALYSIRACAPGLGCPDGAIYDGLIWARDHGMNVVSMSLASCGGSVSTPMASLLIQLAASGVQVVVAGGNGVYTAPNPCNLWDPVSKYATAPGTIAVSAYGADHLFKPGYQYGPAIDLSGPTDVLTTGAPEEIEPFGGTSAATPHVAGALAVLLSAGFQPQHTFTRLAESAYQPSGEPTPRNNHYGFGQIRLGDAAVAKPRVAYLDWCTGAGITTAGLCEMTAHTIDGIAPIQVRFEVTRSDQPGTVSYGWGSPTRNIQVDAGDYTLSVEIFAREQYYLRAGLHSIQEIPVCTGSALLASPKPGGSTQSATTCGGGNGGNN